MILKFNEYMNYRPKGVATDKFNQEMGVSADEISDFLIDLEPEYNIELNPIRFEGKKDLSPKKKIGFGKKLIEIGSGTIIIDGINISFFTDWCDNSDLYPKVFNGIGYSVTIHKKDGTLVSDRPALKKILRKINQKRLNFYGLRSSIIKGSGCPFIIIFKIK